MSISLPTLPRGAKVKARFIDFGATLTPVLGGESQHIARLGSRYAVDVELPPLGQAARAWIARRLQAKTENETLLLTWPQLALPAPIGGPVLVNGGGQAGARLSVDGLTPSVTVPELAFFSFSAGSRSYLHATSAEVAAGVGGGAVLAIAPLLRASPADNAVLEFVNPVIEGFLDGNTVDWDLEHLAVVGTSFTLTENK